MDIAELEHLVLVKRVELRAAIEQLSAAVGHHYTPWTPTLQDRQLINCRVLPTRNHILDYVPKNSVCMEVGTQTGRFALDIIRRCNPERLHVIDVNYSLFEREPLQESIGSGRLIIHEGDSSTIIKTFPDAMFDWIYIDGDHSYEGFVKDLRASAPKVKPNGLIVCNDYTVWSPAEVSPYGILQGVNEFCTQENWEFVFFALHPQGYHDVALRRCAGPRPPGAS